MAPVGFGGGLLDVAEAAELVGKLIGLADLDHM